MDLAHLVHAALLRAGRSPALHFVAIGAALFALTGEPVRDEEGDRLVIAPHRLQRLAAEFRQATGREPSAKERRDLTEHLVQQELLYQYALRMKLQEQPVVRRRLAQIAAFVAENPHEPATEDERADEALALGLHRDDLIVRRILIDGARRLIRAPWLVREPDDATLGAYLEAHRESFELPADTRITQVALNRLKHGALAERRAAELAERLETERLTPAETIPLGDALPVAASLPPLSEQELARKLGQRFAAAVQEAPVGEWTGPIPSRYGLHLVYVHERRPPRLPSLDDVRASVRKRFLSGVADQWLALRLAQLRSSFAVVVPEVRS